FLFAPAHLVPISQYCSFWPSPPNNVHPKTAAPLRGLDEMAIWCVENLADTALSASIFSCQLAISSQIPAHAMYVNTP
ncbi:MAG: hypothetical protein ACHQAY_01995, partial [Hyphomicrobiales bacterium]